MKRLAAIGLVLCCVPAFVLASDYVRFGQVTVANSAIGITATLIVPTDGSAPPARFCKARLEAAEVRVRYDGTAPTTTVGTLLEPGDVIEFDTAADASRALFIRTGATSGVLDVHCGY